MDEVQLAYAEEWARWIRTWIETFPELVFRHAGWRRREMLDKLAFALAVVLWDVTVVHSTDHNDFAADIPVEWKCFRLRRPAPGLPMIDARDRRLLSKRIDIFKSYLAHRMFFAPTTVTRLMQVDYDFETDSLRAAQTRHKERLRAIEGGLAAKGIRRYMALEEMAASIQY